jgi:hypothetical protein
MQTDPRIPTPKSPPTWFTGDVWLEHVSDDVYLG